MPSDVADPINAIGNRDKVGLLLFTDEVELYLPPRKSRSHGLRVVRELLYHPPRGRGTDIGQALDALHRVQKKKAVVFLLSDFLDRGYDRPLMVTAKRHDLIAMQLTDPRERSIPSVGLLRVHDPERGEDVLLDTSDPQVVAAYERNAESRQTELEKKLRRVGCDLVQVDVTQSVVDPLQRFFRRRERRR